MDPEPISTDSIANLLRGILGDLRTLIRDELELARTEMTDQVGRARRAAARLAMAVGAIAFGGLFLLIAIALGVADVLAWPTWAGFLIVAIALTVVGLAALIAGRRQLNAIRPIPGETVSTLKENSAWIAHRLSSVRR